MIWHNFRRILEGAGSHGQSSASESAGCAFSCLYIQCILTIKYLSDESSLKYVSLTVVSTYVYLQPVIAAVVSLVPGQDRLTWFKAFTALLVFPGVYLVSTGPDKQRNASPASTVTQ
ncbi:MAG TPA: EamA family transporter [Bacteroidales bacterium]|nr:EamA family transporter [Bacteroidales bacterium]